MTRWTCVAAGVALALSVMAAGCGSDSSESSSATDAPDRAEVEQSQSTSTTGGAGEAVGPVLDPANLDEASVVEPVGEPGAQTGPVQVDGSTLPDFGRSSVDLAVGAPAPRIDASDFDARPVSIVPGDGLAKLVVFFAHWCPHCQDELPKLTEWINTGELSTDGVDIIAVSTAVDSGAPNHPPSDWFRDEGWPLSVVRDSDSRQIAEAYGLPGFPYTVVVGADGTVVERRAGGQPLDAWREMAANAKGG